MLRFLRPYSPIYDLTKNSILYLTPDLNQYPVLDLPYNYISSSVPTDVKAIEGLLLMVVSIMMKM